MLMRCLQRKKNSRWLFIRKKAEFKFSFLFVLILKPRWIATRARMKLQRLVQRNKNISALDFTKMIFRFAFVSASAMITWWTNRRRKKWGWKKNASLIYWIRYHWSLSEFQWTNRNWSNDFAGGEAGTDEKAFAQLQLIKQWKPFRNMRDCDVIGIKRRNGEMRHVIANLMRMKLY